MKVFYDNYAETWVAICPECGKVDPVFEDCGDYYKVRCFVCNRFIDTLTKEEKRLTEEWWSREKEVMT